MQVQSGKIKVLDSVQIKDRFIQAMNTARDILADFRAVEQNFRELDRNTREKIASWNKGKGELLNAFFHAQDGINDSEQGKSFSAFYRFLMSRTAQDDFESTINQVIALEPVQEIPSSKIMQRIEFDWLKGSEHIQDTIALISQQLKRYVDESYLEEERRIHHVVKNIEALAISLREHTKYLQDNDFMQIDAIRPEISLPLDRPLFTPPAQTKLADVKISYGIGEGSDEALYNQVYVDKDLLIKQINHMMGRCPEATLRDVLTEYPLKLGLSELVAYLCVAREHKSVVFNYGKEDEIFWIDKENVRHSAKLPQIIFKKLIEDSYS